jgi:hypothetical protein
VKSKMTKLNEVINHKRGDCIWYHTTTPDRLLSIKLQGLKCGSPPTWQSKAEPWIYVSTEPWTPLNELLDMADARHIILQVDLSWLESRFCGWPFVEPDTKEWDDRWQLRVFKDIPSEYIFTRDGASIWLQR